MKKIKMEEVTDLKELNESDYLLILFKENKKGIIYKFIKDDYFISIFDDIIYIFDRGVELKAKFPMEIIDKFVKVVKE